MAAAPPRPELGRLFDCSGVAVLTGAASGFGLEAAERCAAAGMRVAILDVDTDGLDKARAKLIREGARPEHCLTVLCNVGSHGECQAAAEAVAKAFPGTRIAFLFNNAGIANVPAEQYAGNVLGGTPSDSGWRRIFDVNVFGVVNVLKVFATRMVDAGPFPSGMMSQIVTTSSVMGLYDGAMGVNPYNASKMACTAICEQFHLELEAAGTPAGHVASHSLHPSMAGTNIFGNRAITEAISAGTGGRLGGLSAGDVIDALFAGIAAGTFYIVVDDAKDKPAREQIRQRMESQMAGTAPKPHTPMAGLGVAMKIYAREEARSKL